MRFRCHARAARISVPTAASSRHTLKTKRSETKVAGYYDALSAQTERRSSQLGRILPRVLGRSRSPPKLQCTLGHVGDDAGTESSEGQKLYFLSPVRAEYRSRTFRIERGQACTPDGE